MNQKLNKVAVPGLRWTLGLVVLWQASRELLHAVHAIHDHTRALPLIWVRTFLASAETLAAILFLLPRTRIAGSYMLLVVLVLAVGIHLAHGEWGILSLSVYVMALLVSLANE